MTLQSHSLGLITSNNCYLHKSSAYSIYIEKTKSSYYVIVQKHTLITVQANPIQLAENILHELDVCIVS